MKQEDLENMMENLSIPEVENERHKNKLRLTLLDARRTAGFSILLIIIPLLFALANILNYELGIQIGWMIDFADWIASLDDTPILNWIVRMLLIGGPFAVILLNLLAITHFSYSRHRNELLFSFKLKWMNIAWILFCGILLSVFAAVLIVENVNHP